MRHSWVVLVSSLLVGCGLPGEQLTDPPWIIVGDDNGRAVDSDPSVLEQAFLDLGPRRTTAFTTAAYRWNRVRIETGRPNVSQATCEAFDWQATCDAFGGITKPDERCFPEVGYYLLGDEPVCSVRVGLFEVVEGSWRSNASSISEVFAVDFVGEKVENALAWYAAPEDGIHTEALSGTLSFELHHPMIPELRTGRLGPWN